MLVEHARKELLAYFDWVSTAGFASPSAEADAQVPEGLEVHIVMDNYATHKTPKIKAWLTRRPHYHVHFPPTSASWINQVERWFAGSSEEAAEQCFSRALDVAREQGALFWESRAAIDLARLRIGQRRPADARGILEPIYRRFTEGFETPDLKSAERLLSTLR